MCERDMMYGGYFQNMPGNTIYGNFGYQTPPGNLMPMSNNMAMGNYLYTDIPQNNMISNNPYNTMGNNNPLIDINARLSNLENRVKTLEQKDSNNSSYQDDNSMYML